MNRQVIHKQRQSTRCVRKVLNLLIEAFDLAAPSLGSFLSFVKQVQVYKMTFYVFFPVSTFPRTHCRLHKSTLLMKFNSAHSAQTLCTDTVHRHCTDTVYRQTLCTDTAQTLCTDTVHRHCTDTVHRHCAQKLCTDTV